MERINADIKNEVIAEIKKELDIRNLNNRNTIKWIDDYNTYNG